MFQAAITILILILNRLTRAISVVSIEIGDQAVRCAGTRLFYD